MSGKREEQREGLDSFMQQLISCTLSSDGSKPSTKKLILDFLKVEENISGNARNRIKKSSPSGGSAFDCKCGEYVTRQLGCAAGWLGGESEANTDVKGADGGGKGSMKRQRSLGHERMAVTSPEADINTSPLEEDSLEKVEESASLIPPEKQDLFQQSEEVVGHFPTIAVRTITKAALEMAEKANFIFDEEGLTIQVLPTFFGAHSQCSNT
jgi:hypothetical protein